MDIIYIIWIVPISCATMLGIYYLLCIFKNDDIIKKTKILLPSEVQEDYFQKNKRQFIDFSKTEKANANIDTELYESKWYVENLSDEANPLEKRWKSRILMDSIPNQSNVIMYYDVYRNGFAYYADSSLSHHTLDAVALKYVRTFMCSDFFMDEQISERKSPILALLTTESSSSASSSSSSSSKKEFNQARMSVFTKIQKPVSNVRGNGVPTNISQKTIALPPKIDYVTNKYIRVGTVRQFPFLTPKKAVNPYAKGESKFTAIFDTDHATQTTTMDYKKWKLAVPT